MKLIVFGASGQVGSELARRLKDKESSRFLDRSDVDLADPESAAGAILIYKPDLVINAAAWTNVDLAETHQREAHVINALAPEAMAKACATLQIPFLHLSTDYVFNGEGAEPFSPEHRTLPLNAYGHSKLAGERGIKESGANYFILRTSWVFSAHGKNFLKTMLRLGRERTELSVVSDQFGGPTPASAIAEALLRAAYLLHAGKRGGVYHFAGWPDVSWFEFAEFIMSTANLRCKVKPILTADYPTPAKRPLNSRLDCSSFLKEFNIVRPDWRAGVIEALDLLAANI